MSSATQLTNASLLNPIYPPIPMPSFSLSESEGTKEPIHLQLLIQREEDYETLGQKKYKILNRLYLFHSYLMEQVLNYENEIDCDSLHRHYIKPHSDDIGDLFSDFSQSDFSQEDKNKIFLIIEKHINPCEYYSYSFNPCAYCINNETMHLYEVDGKIEHLLNREIEQLSNKISLIKEEKNTPKGDSYEIQNLKNLKNQQKTIQKIAREVHKLFINIYRFSSRLMEKILTDGTANFFEESKSLHPINSTKINRGKKLNQLSKKLQKVVPPNHGIFNLIRDIKKQFNNESLSINTSLIDPNDIANKENKKISSIYRLDNLIKQIINNNISLLKKEITVQEDKLYQVEELPKVSMITFSTGTLILSILSSIGVASAAIAIGCCIYRHFNKRRVSRNRRLGA